MIALDQSLTNGGWDEGGPTRGSNRYLIENLEVEVEQRWRTKPFVVPAETRVWDDRPHRTGDAVRERLPNVTCSALLLSIAGRQRCAIVWFQDVWAPPIDVGVLEQLRDASLDFGQQNGSSLGER